MEDNGIATIDLSGAYPNLYDGQTYYIVVWSPYFASSYEWMWFLNDPVPFTIGNGPSITLIGDVDNNAEVNIADVTALIDYLLSGDATGINLDASDVDRDGEVNIADVTSLIDMLLQM